MKLMQMRHSLFPCHFLLSLTFPQILKANYKLEGERRTQRKRPLEKLIMAEVCMDRKGDEREEVVRSGRLSSH